MAKRNYLACDRVKIKWIIFFGVMFITSSNVFAYRDKTDNVASETKQELAKENVEVSSVRDLEVGSGGNIKTEREYRAKKETLHEWHAHLLWESRYVTEGRDNLAGKNLISVSTEFSLDGFSVVPWIADSAAADYSEFNLNVINGFSLTDDLVLYAGYNYIHSRTLGEKDNDNEVSLDLAYSVIKHVNAVASIYHSFDVQGSFLEMAVKYNNVLDKKVHYGVQGVIGANAGYVPDGHKGLNHFQLRGNVSYYLVQSLELYAYTGYNVAIDRDEVKFAGDELLRDFVWSGVGLLYLF